MKKRLIAGLCALALVLGLTACGAGEGAPSGAGTPAQTAQGTPDLSGVTLRVAAASAENAQGLLEAAGLDDTPYQVDFTVMQGGNLVMEALAAGQIDLGTGSQIPPIGASQAANGGNFKIVAIRRTNTLDQELILPPNSTITSVAQLRGKSVGYVKNTTAHYFLEKMLEQAGLEWTDINALPLTTSDGLSAVLSNEVDALASYGNAIRSAKSRGATTLQSAEDILTGDFYWYAAPAAIEGEATHAALADYFRRYHDAAEWTRQNPEAYATYLSNLTGENYDEVLSLFLAGNEQKQTQVLPVSDETIASEQDIADTFYKLGVFEDKIDASTLFDHSFDEEIGAFTKY